MNKNTVRHFFDDEGQLIGPHQMIRFVLINNRLEIKKKF